MGHMISPTNSWEVRNDQAGFGYFGAPRVSRLHNGVDLVCVPKSDVYAPISGKIVREAYPYVGDLKWTGCLIENQNIAIKMFYMRLLSGMVGKDVKQGEVIGKAQDITHKYKGQGMTPHIHIQIDKINPELLI